MPNPCRVCKSSKTQPVHPCQCADTLRALVLAAGRLADELEKYTHPNDAEMALMSAVEAFRKGEER